MALEAGVESILTVAAVQYDAVASFVSKLTLPPLRRSPDYAGKLACCAGFIPVVKKGTWWSLCQRN